MEHPTQPTGIKVAIPRGTEITGTFPGPARRAGRRYSVDVFRLSPGYLPTSTWDVDHGVGRVATVTFVGSGGYWCEVAVEDVVVDQGHHRMQAWVNSHEVVTREMLAQAVARLA